MKRALVILLLFISGPALAVTMELTPDHVEVRVKTEPVNGSGGPYAVEINYKGDVIYKFSHPNFATINSYKHIVLTKTEKAASSNGILILSSHLTPNSPEWLVVSNQATIDELLPRLKELENRLERLENN